MAGKSPEAKLRSAAPVFLVGDVASTMRWYEANLGFAPDPFPASPPHVFCILRRDGLEIMLQHLAGYRPPDLYPKRAGGVWNVYFRMEGVRELFQQIARRADVTVLEPLHRQPYGQTEFVIEDTNGYTLVFAESLGG